MLHKYELFACIDFETDSYAISVPLLKRAGSNYTYIPKTDHNFMVTDFYEMMEIGYPLSHLNIEDQVYVSIGELAPVPILENGTIFVVDPAWSADEIRSKHPRLGTDAFKAFISLRTRMAAKPLDQIHEEIGHSLDELLEDPVRSRYWISRYSALVRSAFAAGKPSQQLEQRMQDARELWLTKFGSKTSLKHVQALIDLKLMPLDETKRNRILTQRFERLLLTKGLYLPISELRAYGALFPSGILSSLFKYDHEPPAWQRLQTLSRFLSNQVYDLTQRIVDGAPRGDVPDRWNIEEVERVLTFFTTVSGDTYDLDEPAKYFLPIFQNLLATIREKTANRSLLISVIEDSARSQHHSHFYLGEFAHNWKYGIRKLLEEYEKLVVLSKIVRPVTRHLPSDEILISGIDYLLIEALRKSLQTNDLRPLRDLMTASVT